MKAYICTKCGSQDLFLEEKQSKNGGLMTGLYCGDCGNFIKWVNKKEKRLVQRYLENK